MCKIRVQRARVWPRPCTRPTCPTTSHVGLANCDRLERPAAFLPRHRSQECATEARRVLIACTAAWGCALLPQASCAHDLEHVLEYSPKEILEDTAVMRYRHRCMPQMSVSDDVGFNNQIYDAGFFEAGDRNPPPVCDSPQIQYKLRPFRPGTGSAAVPLYVAAEAAELNLNAAAPPALHDRMATSGSTDIPAKYVPGPVEVGWQIYVGSAVAAFPFFLGAYEFGKRILIQRRYAPPGLHACLLETHAAEIPLSSSRTVVHV
jgi:hypothetical protein